MLSLLYTFIFWGEPPLSRGRLTTLHLHDDPFIANHTQHWSNAMLNVTYR